MKKVDKKEPTFAVKEGQELEVEAELLNLKNQPGWQRLEKYFDEKVKWLELQLAEGDIEKIEELKLLRAKRNMAIQFRNLPDILIEVIKKSKGSDPILDPYA